MSTTLVPLVVVLPLLAAAGLAAVAQLAPARFDDLVAIAVSVAVTVLCVLLVFRAADRTIASIAIALRTDRPSNLGRQALC